MHMPTVPTRQGPCSDCVIVAEAEHRIANHLAILAGLVRQKLSTSRDASPADAWLGLNAVRLQMDALASLHRALTSRRSMPVDLDGQLKTVASSFSILFGDRISIVEDYATGAELTPEQLLPLTQIVSEVLTNAVKHAGDGGRPGRVFARSFLGGDGDAVVEIADEGLGLPSAFDPTRDGGLGFRVIRSSAKALGAAIEFHSSDSGLCFRLILPQALWAASCAPARRSHS